jgi:type II secretory pathway component PulF
MGVGIKKQISILEGLEEMEKSNFPVSEALSMLAENKDIEKYILEIQEELNEGAEIPEAIDNAGIFDDYIISIIKASYESGSLGNGYSQAKRLLMMEHKFQKALKGVVVYPIVVFLMANLSIYVVLLKIVPRLGPIFKMLKGNLLLDTYWWGYQHIWVVVTLNILLYLTGYLLVKKGIIYSFMLHLPKIKTVLRKREKAVFFNIMDVMYSANLPMNEILYQACMGAGSFDKYADMATGLSSRSLEYFFEELYDDGLIDKLILTKLVRGTKTGGLPDSIKAIAVAELEEYEDMQKNLKSIIEPLINLVLITSAIAPIAPLYVTIIAGMIDKYIQ